MTPEAFIAKWERVTTKERTASQTHFNDLCDVLGLEKPLDADPDGTHYTFERVSAHGAGGQLSSARVRRSVMCRMKMSGSVLEPYPDRTLASWRTKSVQVTSSGHALRA